MVEVLIGSAIGVIGALVGALAGAGWEARLSARQADLLEQRRKREEDELRANEVMAAARLVVAEFGLAAVCAESAAGSGATVALQTMPTTAWSTHGVLLAGALPAETFSTVMEAASKIATIVELARTAPPEQATSEAAEGVPLDVVRLAGICRRAQDALQPFAYA